MSIKDFGTFKNYLNDLDYEFNIKLFRDYPYSVCNKALFCENDWGINSTSSDYTERNLFYVYLGHLICKHGKYILEHFANCITASIQEIEENYMNLDLTAEEQLEILEIARQVKDDLPKLEVFPDSTSLISRETEEYKNEKGLE